jgi:hypothetical protein
MKIKFKQDYIGRETAMKEYAAGDTTELSTAQALELIRLGVVEEVELVTTLDGPMTRDEFDATHPQKESTEKEKRGFVQAIKTSRRRNKVNNEPNT